MQKELLNQSIEIFDSLKKWSAFIELSDQRKNISNTFTNRIHKKIDRYFKENLAESWAYDQWDKEKGEFLWYLKDFGKDSLRVGIGWIFELHLRLGNRSEFNIDIIRDLVKDSRYSQVFLAFDRIDRKDDMSVAIEDRNYYFDDCPYNGDFSGYLSQELIWYAGNKTDDLADQIITKVEKFTNNQEVTDLIYELNEKSDLRPKNQGGIRYS